MRLVSLLLVSCLVCHAHAQAPTELLGKLVKGDDQSRTPADNVSVSLDEDGSHDLTRDGGLFHLFLAKSLKPGVEVTISVKIVGYAIYKPLGGKLTIPNDLLHRQEIQLLPKGSPKFLSDEQLRAFIERTAKESSRAATEQRVKQPPDLSLYLKDWAVEYGFSVDQVQAEVNRWAAEVESKKSSNYDLSLAAFAKKNFGEAHNRAIEAAAEEESRLAGLVRQQQEAIHCIVRDYRFAGDAAYNALDYRKASDAYKKALAYTSRRGRSMEWADLQADLGKAEIELISRSEGTAISEHEDLALSSYEAALTIYSRDQGPRQWAQIQNERGVLFWVLAERTAGIQGSVYLQQAVSAYQDALQVRTREQVPQDWAMTQSNLGVAFSRLAVSSSGSQVSWYFQKAVSAYQDALQVRTREQAPQDWAMTESDLGGALVSLAEVSKGPTLYSILKRPLRLCNLLCR